MEFGVQFSAICEDLRGRNLVKNYFPYYDLDPKHEPIIPDSNDEPIAMELEE
jgi:hypothetical protein